MVFFFGQYLRPKGKKVTTTVKLSEITDIAKYNSQAQGTRQAHELMDIVPSYLYRKASSHQSDVRLVVDVQRSVLTPRLKEAAVKAVASARKPCGTPCKLIVQ